MYVVIFMQIDQSKGYTGTNASDLWLSQRSLGGIDDIRDRTPHAEFHNNPQLILEKKAILSDSRNAVRGGSEAGSLREWVSSLRMDAIMAFPHFHILSRPKSGPKRNNERLSPRVLLP